MIINKGRRAFTFTCIYNPPGIHSEDLLSLISTIEGPNIIVGDFNLPHLEMTGNKTEFERKFTSLCIQSNLTQLVRDCTRYSNNSSSLLDLVMTNETDLIHELKVMNGLGRSDHCSIMFEINHPIPHKDTKKIIKQYSRADYTSIKRTLLEQEWHEILASDIDTSWSRFSKIIRETDKKYVPTAVLSRKNKVWFNREASNLMKKKRRRWDEFKTNKISLREYKTTCNYVVKQLRLIKKKYENRIFDNKNKQQFYSYVNRALNEQNCLPKLKSNNEILSDQEAADQFIRTFQEVYEPVSNRLSVEYDSVPETITIEELKNSLSRISPSKPAGEDKIHPSLIHFCKNELFEPLLLLYNKSITQRKFPKELKKSSITPVFKSGSRFDAKNYRPIHVTDALSKPLEAIMMRRMNEHLNSIQFKNDSQHGFVQRRSVTTNLIESSFDWINALNRNEVTDIIYFDFSKAFDKMNILILINKMTALGFPEYMVNWTQDYLRDRTLRVRVGDCLSHEIKATSGVPQGSVLGPFLFGIYVSQPPSLSICNVKQFADDVKLYASFDKKSTTASQLIQQDINSFVNWTENELKMTLNSSKTTVIHIGNMNPKNEYNINGSRISAQLHQRDLGVIISHDLSWEKHINSMVRSAFGVVYMIKKSFTSLTRKQFLLIYKTFIRPKIEFCSSVWSPHHQYLISMVEKVQRKATKLVNNISHLPYNSRLSYLGLTTLETRRLRGDLIEMFKIMRGYYDIPSEPLFTPRTQRLRRQTVQLKGHCYTLAKPFSRLDLHKHSLFSRQIHTWNGLPSHIIQSTSLNEFKNLIDLHITTHVVNE